MYLILLNKLKLTININGKYVLARTGERNGTDSLELEASICVLSHKTKLTLLLSWMETKNTKSVWNL